MSIIFSEEPSKGKLHLLPKETDAISYSYTSDILTLSAHLKDGAFKVNQPDPNGRDIYSEFWGRHCFTCTYEQGGRCEPVRTGTLNNAFSATQTHCPANHELATENNVKFDVAPAIFQIRLNLTGGKKRFVSVDTGMVWLQASRVINKKIKLSKRIEHLANTHNTHTICWGHNNEMPKNLRGQVNLFFESPFNNDLTRINQFERNCLKVRADVENDNFYKKYSTEYNYISEQADALYLIHAEDHVATFFWLLSAGFKPIKEAPFLIILPLNEMQIEHEGVVYSGYSTPMDSCKKQWFINRSGDLLGQM